MFFEEKNQGATSSTNKNQHATGSIKQISFTRKETNVKVSQFTSFNVQGKNQDPTSFAN